jgi:ssDNA-binding Zn-finger/Zn-ribbon topoisomerase 1
VASIDLEIYTDDPTEVAALQAYWQLADDGESWAQTVTAIRAEHGLTQQEMTRLVRECAFAHLLDVKCPSCGDPSPLSSRANFAEIRRQGNVLCPACRAEAEAEKARLEKERAAARRAALIDTFPVHDTEAIQAYSLSLFTAVALHALFSDPAVEDAGLTTPTSIWPKDRPWAPGSLHYDYERRLMHGDRPVIRSHYDSHADAFVWEDGTPTGSFYLGQVSYYLLGPQVELRDRPAGVLHELNRIFREGPWPEAWLGQWRDLWDELALAQASAYLDMKLGEHHLEMKQGDGTRAALADALATFSLGQVFNFIYRAAKDSAAYYQRGGVNKRQAANSTVGRISAAADRARANGWEIKSFGMPWNLPMSAIGETFFSKVMWQADMMHVAARDAHPPLHAASSTDTPTQRSEPSDDDINDCTQCGRRFYGEGLCPECSNA